MKTERRAVVEWLRRHDVDDPTAASESQLRRAAKGLKTTFRDVQAALGIAAAKITKRTAAAWLEGHSATAAVVPQREVHTVREKSPARLIQTRMVLFGKPGCGKGTLAEGLARRATEKDLVLPHLSTGDLLRGAKGTELGDRAATLMDQGELVPDEIMIPLVEERFDVGMVDGYPRTVEQAKAMLAAGGIEAVVLLDAPDDILYARIENRAATSEKPRSDDTPEKLTLRLETYHRETEPLVELFERAGLLVRIDAQRSPDEVLEEVVRRVPSLRDALAIEP